MLSWEDKIRSWIPKHFKGRDNDANIQAIAKCFETLDTDLKDYIEQTFITLANSEYLDVHGQERGFSRINYGTTQSPNLEEDADYANRIRRIKYNRTAENIINNVQSVLGVIDVRVIDDYLATFLDGTDQRATNVVISGGTFGNQGPLDLKKRWNCFSVVIDTPERPPLSFFDDKYYYGQTSSPPTDRTAWLDEGVRQFSSATARIIYELIKLKAPAGSGFRLLVKDFAGIDVGDESEQEANLNL